MSQKPFIPHELPPKIDLQSIQKPLGEAHHSLSKYVGLLKTIDMDLGLFISQFQSTEAHTSSLIEGSQTEIKEIIEASDGKEPQHKDPEMRDDLTEVINYRRTLKLTVEDTKPFGLYLIRQCHQELLKGSVRGAHKNPGRIRTKQNYIGSRKKVKFIPPEPHLVEENLKKLLKYVNSNEHDILLQTAILHAQFEIIHPFDDGNGRVGRLLIPLFLYKKGYIPYPYFYISEYIYENQREYYDQLMHITNQNNWNEWLLFFFTAIQEQSELLCKRVDKAYEFYKSTQQLVQKEIHSRHSLKVVDYIFQNPIFNIPQLVSNTNIKIRTAHTFVKKLKELKLVRLYREAKGTRSASWELHKLTDILLKQ